MKKRFGLRAGVAIALAVAGLFGTDAPANATVIGTWERSESYARVNEGFAYSGESFADTSSAQTVGVSARMDQLIPARWEEKSETAPPSAHAHNQLIADFSNLALGRYRLTASAAIDEVSASTGGIPGIASASVSFSCAKHAATARITRYGGAGVDSKAGGYNWPRDPMSQSATPGISTFGCDFEVFSSPGRVVLIAQSYVGAQPDEVEEVDFGVSQRVYFGKAEARVRATVSAPVLTVLT